MEMPEGLKRFFQSVEDEGLFRDNSVEDVKELFIEMAEALESAAGYGNSAEVLQKFKDWK